MLPAAFKAPEIKVRWEAGNTSAENAKRTSVMTTVMSREVMNQKPQLGQIIWFMCKNAHVISAIQDSGKEPPIATSQQSQNVQVNHLDAFRRVQCVQCHRQTSQVAHSGTYPGHEEVEKTRLARQGMQLPYATLCYAHLAQGHRTTMWENQGETETVAGHGNLMQFMVAQTQDNPWEDT